MPKPSTSPDRRTCAAPGCSTPLRSDNKTGVCSPCSRARKGPGQAKPARPAAPRAPASPAATAIVRSLPSAPSVLVAGLDVEQLLQLLSEGRRELVRRKDAARSLASRIESAIEELGT